MNCNFMSWMPAARQQASSTTPAAPTNKAPSVGSDTFKDLTCLTTVGGDGAARQASSSDALNQSMGAADGTSRNHLAMSDSVETVCEMDQTQTNRFVPYIGYEERVMPPLEVRIESPPLDDFSAELSIASHIAQIDDKECEELEAEVRYWEQKVEEMERKQFAEYAPRTLVDNILKHRKELRELEFISFQRMLESEESDRQSCEEKISHILKLCDSDSDQPMSPGYEHDYQNDCSNMADKSPAHSDQQHARAHPQDFITNFNDLGSAGIGDGNTRATGCSNGRLGSQIKPGQENTAEILNAVPPSGSLQHRQYLSKASSGTDWSQYSQLPTFDQHKHRVVRHHPLSQHQRHRHQHQHKHQHQQIYQEQRQFQNQNHQSQRLGHHQENHSHQTYIQVDAFSEAAEVLQDRLGGASRSSPIRPDHFKGEFKQPKHMIAQDSSSPASSSNES